MLLVTASIRGVKSCVIHSHRLEASFASREVHAYKPSTNVLTPPKLWALRELARDNIVQKALTLMACFTVSALKILSNPDNLPAMLNCAHGKDRTGLVSALVLACLGKSKEYIAADYSRSQVCKNDKVNEWDCLTDSPPFYLKISYHFLSFCQQVSSNIALN